MMTHSITIPTQKPQAVERSPVKSRGSCNCDRECRCDDTCCSLACLEQPRFFCGQLLTERDLNALLKWTKDKARLTRYRDGWGVVCGLEVRCDPDPKQPAGVIVGTGYALSCCGDDVIVCDDAHLDLGKYCLAEDPCAEPGRLTLATAGAPGSEVRSPLRSRAINTLVGDERRPASARRAFDIYIRYKEQLTDPQTALNHRNCSCGGSECEYSRVRESFELYAEAAPANSDPMRAHADEWARGYDDCLELLDEFNQRFGAALSSVAERKSEIEVGDDKSKEDVVIRTVDRDLARDVRTWLLRRIEEHHPHQFCFLHDRICALKDEEIVRPAELVRIFLLLVQDCRNAYLTCDCHDCRRPSGVPLARVWLEVKEEHGRQTCRIVCIDGYPPYRRALSDDCWPAPLGLLNLGSQIWHRPREVCLALAGMGVRVAGESAYQEPDSLAGLEDDLRRLGSRSLFVPCGEPVSIVYYASEEEDECLAGGRVLGFRLAESEGGKAGSYIRNESAINRMRESEAATRQPAAEALEQEAGAGDPPRAGASLFEEVKASMAARRTTRAQPDESRTSVLAGRPIEAIDGIGPERGGRLRARGIATTSDLRLKSVEEIGEILDDVTVKTIKRFIADAAKDA